MRWKCWVSFEKHSHSHNWHPCVFFNSNTLNQCFAKVPSSEQTQPTFGRQFWPFPSTSTSFYWPSELRRAQFEEQQQIIVDGFNQLSSQSSSSNSSWTHSPNPVVASTSSAQPVEESSQVKTKKVQLKSADWTEDETHDILEAWGPKYSHL